MESQQRIEEIEALMRDPHFWEEKVRAQNLVKELNRLKKEALDGEGGYDGGSAVMTIFAGAGGDDAEDFARILSDMYMRFIEKKGWGIFFLHRNSNDHSGVRNITFEINGKGAYGELKNESGVHRLVRLSPFNAKSLRHTSFAMVEVVPKFEKVTEEDIPEDEISTDFIRSSGPGGQNVNKRETAVRIVHLPTKLSVHIDSERSQAQNRLKALALLKGKLYRLREDERVQKEKGMYISKTTSAQWGNQIRSYVLHPYKMVKDHRTGVEIRDTEAVLRGEIENFLEAEKDL